jgi:hypothetical protein
MVSVTYAAAKERCIGGCSVSWGAGVVNPVDAAKYVAGLVSATGVSGYYYISFNGATCSPATTLIPADISMVPKDTSGTAADGVTADAKNKPETNQSSEACAAVGGSWGVYNGVAKCLTDTSNRMAPVTVNKKSSTTQNPDGSSVITTETTTSYKDPVTGELRARTDSSTTNKDSGGNVTGTGGSVTTGSGGGTGNGSAGESSDLCKNNPGLDLCNDRLNKEETQKKVHDVLESLAQGGFEDFDKVKNAKQSIESDDALKVETDKFEQAADGTVDSVSSQKSSWETAMQSGWFDPIPAGSCAPLTAQIGPWFWTIDICPTAEKIAGISEYVLWLGFVIGVFVMFTGGMVRM